MLWQHKAVLFVALPVFTLCAATLYYYFRKDKEWEEYLKSLNYKYAEVKVPKDAVGAVIGRCGTNIRDIQEKTNTRINFKDNVQDEKGFKICKIRGEKDNVDIAERLILETIATQSSIKSYEMWVPAKSCGRIIGRCGDNIRAIGRASNASITLDKMSPVTNVDQKLLIIKGTEEQIAIAKTLIEEKIKEEEDARNKMQYTLSNRSPRLKSKRDKKNLLEEKREPQYERLMASANENMIKVYVSSVANPNNFWLQLITPKSGDLDHLVENMTDYYSLEENREAHKLLKVQIGQIVAAKLRADNKWYRVEVKSFENEQEEQNPDTTVIVFFVDYGDFSSEKVQDLFQLRADFLSLRFQAIEVLMKGIVPKGGAKNWSEKEITTFEDLVFTGQWKMMMAQVIEYKSIEGNNKEVNCLPCIRLYNPEGTPGVDIAKKMIELGEADPEPVNVSDTGVEESDETATKLEEDSDKSEKESDQGKSENNPNEGEIVDYGATVDNANNSSLNSSLEKSSNLNAMQPNSNDVENVNSPSIHIPNKGKVDSKDMKDVESSLSESFDKSCDGILEQFESFLNSSQEVETVINTIPDFIKHERQAQN
ncbi:tudor and KH domain-containing protein homolog [Cimex lectularius]|uniref:Tudor domain-containing protein n=1 Tax=Cimex lectularius TaxID=79782 RepID=A0A8I6RUT1_CIMLE|nr:tudor and KH domain-containing protein homolog [Cimex lectularius]